MADEKDIALIRVLQREETFLQMNPYGWVADELGWTIEEVLERTRAMKASGVIRRFGAAVTPTNAGFTSNAMIVWECAEADEQRAGQAMAPHERISHCYARKTFPGFTYSLYTMVHASSPEDLERVIEELKVASKLTKYRIFTSLKEYKKSSPIYFPETQRAESVENATQRAENGTEASTKKSRKEKTQGTGSERATVQAG